MTKPSARGAGDGGRHATWPERLAIGFVALSLLLLLVVPLITSRFTDRLRDRLDDAADPARALVTEIQYQLAREMGSIRGYILTRDTTFLARYRETVERHRESEARLAPLVRQLGDEPVTAFIRLRVRTDRWHRQVRPEHVATAVGEAAVGSLQLEQAIYDDALDAATLLDQSIAAAVRSLREETRRAERIGMLVALGLVALALASLGVLSWFGHRIRELAREAERRRLEVEAALEETRRTGQARDRLVRGVTHDVKNPLGAADGYAELLELGLRGSLAPAQAETVQAIRRSIRSALDIIGELLELARAERGTLPLEPRPVVLDDVIRDTVDAHRGAAEAAGHTLELRLPPEPTRLETDPRRVGQVLGNLLSNAIKYTPGGGHVLLEVSRQTGTTADGGWAVMRVVDDGPGIPAEERERVFLEFHRLDPTDASGHGLGLAISRHVARQLGGDLVLESGSTAGTVFVFRIPLRSGAPPAQPSADPRATAGSLTEGPR